MGIRDRLSALRRKPVVQAALGPPKAEALVRECLAEQARFEAQHPVPFQPDQRREAVRQRIRARVGLEPLSKALELLIQRLVR